MPRWHWVPMLLLVASAGRPDVAQELPSTSGREARAGKVPASAHSKAPYKRKAGRDTCYAAQALPGEPSFGAVFGDSCTGTRRVTSYASNTCNSPTYPGPEILYTFTGEASLADLELTPLGSADLGLFLVRNCASPTTCVDFHDAIGPGAVSTVPRLSSGYLSGIYYVYVDSYYADGPMSCGSYRLSVRGELKIAERVSFSVD